MLTAKSLQEMNDSCMADIQANAAPQAQVPIGATNASSTTFL
jgi:hypothetical protein